MELKPRIQKQRRWLMTGIAILVLVGGVWGLNGQLIHHVWMTVTGAGAPNGYQMMDRKAKTTKPTSSLQSVANVSTHKQQLIGVQTGIVEKRPLSTTVRSLGRVVYNEQRITHVNLRITGWIEQLLVDFTGQPVRKGQPLFTLYSPELVTAQEEYLLAVQALDDLQASPLAEVQHHALQVSEAARDRLRLWTFTDEQIDELEYRGTPKSSVTIFSPVSGFVIEKHAFEGMYVQPQMTMYTIADLSTIWVQGEIYEYEVPFIARGQAAEFSVEAFPGEQFAGQVTYIYPYLNKQSRTVQVRLEFANPQLRLKPDMYGTMSIQVDRGTILAIPEQAVLDSGVRKVVFVEKENGVFEPRDVALGPKVGPFFEVIEGVHEGEKIVISGTFLLDSESKLMASTNMMGSLGMGGVKMEQAQMGEMDMDSMDMGGMKKTMDKDMPMKMNMKKGASSND